LQFVTRPASVLPGGNTPAYFGMAIILATALFLYFLTGALIKPLQSLTELTGEIAQGDLTREAKVTTQDEIGRLAGSFNTMVTNLKNLVLDISERADQVTAFSSQLDSATRDTGLAAEQVSRSVEEMAKAAAAEAEDAQKTSEIIRQMADALGAIGKNTETVSSLSSSFQSIVDEGMASINNQSQLMQKTLQSTQAANAVITDLDNKSKQIGEIVEVITSIADQTNLLALNAAIEAARAGEYGRGFAVVAEEVRKLAEEVGTATQNIASIIKEVQASTNNAVAETNQMAVHIRQQEEAVKTTQKLFKLIESSARNIDSSVQEVSAAVEQMVASSDEVVKSVENISASTEQSAATTEEITAAVEEQSASVQTIANLTSHLNQLAGDLKESVSRFKV